MEKHALEAQMQNEKKEPEESMLERFVKQKERGEESAFEFLIKQNKQGMELFYKQNKKFLKRLRSRAGEEQKEIAEKVDAVFRELYNNSGDFRSVINGLPPRIHRLDELLSDWEGQKLLGKNASRGLLKQFGLLVNLCKKLKLEYEQELWIAKSKPEGWIKIDCYGRLPIRSLYQVRRKHIKRVEANRQEEFVNELRAYKNSFDEIKIDDVNPPLYESRNALIDGLARMSRITPTFVKYNSQDGNKKLLVSLPEYLDVRTLLKEYEKMLPRIHRAFYGRTLRGRPKSKDEKADLILNILEKKLERYDFRRRPPSINKLAEEASKGLKEMGTKKGSSKRYIRSHFIKTFRQFLDAKIRR